MNLKLLAGSINVWIGWWSVGIGWWSVVSIQDYSTKDIHIHAQKPGSTKLVAQSWPQWWVAATWARLVTGRFTAQPEEIEQNIVHHVINKPAAAQDASEHLEVPVFHPHLWMKCLGILESFLGDGAQLRL